MENIFENPKIEIPLGNIEKMPKKTQNTMAFLNRRKAFYKDYYSFTESKRFLRFVGYTEQAISDFFGNFTTKRVDAVTGEVVPSQSGLRLFEELVQDTISYETFKEYSFSENEMDEGTKKEDDFEQKCSVINVVGLIPKRAYSNLWAIHDAMKEAGLDKFDTKDEDEEKSVLLSAVNRTLYDVTKDGRSIFFDLYRDAFRRACYDYVASQSLIQHLDDDNWLFQLKKFTPEQVITISTKIYEYTLQSVEDYASCGMIYSTDETNNGSFFKNLNKYIENAKDEEEKKATLNTLLNTTVKQGEIIDELTEENKKLTEENEKCRKELSLVNVSKQDNIALQRELKRLRIEYEKLESKYNSLLLEQSKESSITEQNEEEEVVDIAPNDKNKMKRIVFIRDKKYDGCVILRRLAEYYPNAKITNGIASEINAKTTDLIVSMSLYVCHGTYWGAKNVSTRKGIPILETKKSNLGAIIAQINKTFDAIEAETE